MSTGGFGVLMQHEEGWVPRATQVSSPGGARKRQVERLPDSASCCSLKSLLVCAVSLGTVFPRCSPWGVCVRSSPLCLSLLGELDQEERWLQAFRVLRAAYEIWGLVGCSLVLVLFFVVDLVWVVFVCFVVVVCLAGGFFCLVGRGFFIVGGGI